ncbi:hypothetical protein CLOP_g23569 [Closterium sp. NIES-67]|nr:hypothetical protein CLOP_g23569 [Closterium sp. NIES-67]
MPRYRPVVCSVKLLALLLTAVAVTLPFLTFRLPPLDLPALAARRDLRRFFRAPPRSQQRFDYRPSALVQTEQPFEARQSEPVIIEPPSHGVVDSLRNLGPGNGRLAVSSDSGGNRGGAHGKTKLQGGLACVELWRKFQELQQAMTDLQANYSQLALQHSALTSAHSALQSQAQQQQRTIQSLPTQSAISGPAEDQPIPAGLRADGVRESTPELASASRGRSYNGPAEGPEAARGGVSSGVVARGAFTEGSVLPGKPEPESVGGGLEGDCESALMACQQQQELMKLAGGDGGDGGEGGEGGGGDVLQELAAGMKSLEVSFRLALWKEEHCQANQSALRWTNQMLRHDVSHLMAKLEACGTSGSLHSQHQLEGGGRGQGRNARHGAREGLGGAVGATDRALLTLWEASPSLQLRDVRSAAVQEALRELRRAVRGEGEIKEGGGKEGGGEEAREREGRKGRQFETLGVGGGNVTVAGEEVWLSEEEEERLVPAAPHVEDCESLARDVSLLDSRSADGALPDWSVWGGRLALVAQRLEEREREKVRRERAREGEGRGDTESEVAGPVQEEERQLRKEEQARLIRQEGRERSLEHEEEERQLEQEEQARSLEHEALRRQVEERMRERVGASQEEAEVAAWMAAARDEQLMGASRKTVLGPYPPWVAGADEGNLVMTRRAQRDIWVQQHPTDCAHPSVKFLVVDVLRKVRGRFLGVGAQVNWLAGVLGTAVGEGRVMVIRHYHRADHDGCTGVHRGLWSCYFVPETSPECRQQALQLLHSTHPSHASPTLASPLGNGSSGGGGSGAAAGNNASDSSGGDWSARRVTLWNEYLDSNKTNFFTINYPTIWGNPWKHMHPTVDVHGRLIRWTAFNRHRWWFAQASTYLMRYPSPRLCLLLNRARHHAFGPSLAARAARFLPADWPKSVEQLPGFTARNALGSEGKIEEIWRATGGGVHGSKGAPPGGHLSGGGAYLPEGLVAVHVRQGDKAGEMAIAGLDVYLALAGRVRRQFPYADSVWLSSEMQSVIDSTKHYTRWLFHATDFPRQALGESMDAYDARVGEQAATENAFVNLLISADAEFFVGTMGSTWSVLIENLRVAGRGKARIGMLSVNRDRYWFGETWEIWKDLYRNITV